MCNCLIESKYFILLEYAFFHFAELEGEQTQRLHGTQAYMHWDGQFAKRVARWATTADSDFINANFVFYNRTSGKFTFRKTAKVEINVKINFETNCNKPPQKKQLQVCLTMESPTLGLCRGTLCCSSPRALDSSPMTVSCHDNDDNTRSSVILIAAPRIKKGDVIFVVARLPDSNITSASISIKT